LPRRSVCPLYWNREARLNEHPPDLLVADLRNLFAGLR
jgi:hypothetical protein